jgi:D-aminopeptidase
MVPDEGTDALNEATVQATEEAIINAMLGARTMRGADDLVVPALPHDRLKTILRKYSRLK